MNLTFDPERHLFTVDGRIVPSVTQIINAVGIGHSATSDTGYEIPEDVMDAARERGTAIHEACQFLDEDDLDWDSLDDDVAAGVRCYEQFREDTGFVPDLIEQPLYCVRDDYCGIPDRIGWIGDDRCVVDLKTSSVGLKPWHGLQLAAYAHADLGAPMRRYVLEFKPQQKRKLYRLHEMPMADYDWDLGVFLAARKIVAWRDMNGK